jgi:uncharacterized protein involved in outer membrane biogenesis
MTGMTADRTPPGPDRDERTKYSPSWTSTVSRGTGSQNALTSGDMRALRWLRLAAGGLVAGATPYWLPQIVRRPAIAQIEAATHRPAAIDAGGLSLLRGRISVRGFRLAKRDGATPFADVERLDGSPPILALLRGHVWIRELLVSGSTVRVVRLSSDDFNLSELIQGSCAVERTLEDDIDRQHRA